MPRIRIRRHARSVRAAFAFFALVACVSYGGVLATDRAGWNAERRPSSFVSDLGNEASLVFHATQEPGMGSLALAVDSRADWVIPTVALDDRGKRIVTIVSGELGFAKPSGMVSILIGGTPALTIRPAMRGRIDVTGAYGPVAGPPVSDRGFRIPVPPANSCLGSSCRVSVRVHDAYWRIFRLAISNEDSISEVGEFR